VTLRPGLLDGRRVAVAGPGTSRCPGTTSAAAVDGVIVERLRTLGACVEVIDAEALRDEDAAADWVRRRAPLHALVFLAGEPFGDGGADRLQETLELAWRSARAAAGTQLIESGEGGRLLFVAPPAGAGPHDEAARAGLENLARTLSVEWARFAITAVAIAPGSETSEAEFGDLTAFLLSAAGGYFSGCRFSLGEAAPAP
jgi:NAD(P)-dependent dehydrogenase (short-subunit alcohol dehydrogenase family)